MFGKTGRSSKGSGTGLGVRGILAILLSLSLLGVQLGSTGSASAAEKAATVSRTEHGVSPVASRAGAASISAAAADRLGGSDRYATAVQISQAGWTGTAAYAVLAAGADANLVDALTAAPLAYQLNAPILFTEGTALTPVTEAELKRLQVKTVYVASGSGVILDSVRDRLQRLGLTVKSLGGADRYATAVNIAKELENQGVAVNQVALTTGLSQADALSIAPVAAGKGMPILLTAPEQLPAVVQEYLAAKQATINKSYVIGGKGAVSETAAAALPGSVTRLGGTDRYATNRQVVQNFLGSFQNRLAYLANGQDGSMADALAGASLAAKNGAPVLLTSGIADAVTQEFALKNLPSQVVALGGTGVVPGSVLSPLRAVQVLSREGSTLGADDPAQPVTYEDNMVLSGAKMTLANATITHSLTVQGDQIKLSHVKVLGTLYLDPGANGSVNLSRVEAGRIVVLSGADHSIIFEDVISQLLQVISSSLVHVVSQGATQINNTMVASNAILDAPSGNLGQVEVARSMGTAGTGITEGQGNGETPANPGVPENAGNSAGEIVGLAAPSVELRGVFTQMIVVSTGASVTAAIGASVAQLTVAPERSAQHISLQGTIRALNIDRQAEVALAANTQVGSTVVNAAALLDATAGSFGQVTLSAKIGSPNSNPNPNPKGIPTPGTGAASLQVVELRGTFAQTIAVSGQVQVKAAQGANVTKLQVAPEQSGQRVVLDGEFANLEVNKEVKIELKDQAKVREAVTNAKTDFEIPKGAEVGKLDPKGMGTTATGGGSVNGSATSEDTTAPPVVVTPPLTNPPTTGGGSSGGSSGGQTGGTQTITVSPITPMGIFVNESDWCDLSDIKSGINVTNPILSASSSDTRVANVSIDGGANKLIVTAGQTAGKALITVTAAKSDYSSGTSTFNVEVFPGKPAAFNLGAATGSLYIDLSGFQDRYSNKINWDALTTTYNIDLQNSKVYLTTADNTTSTVYATLEQLMTRRVTMTTVDANAPGQIVSALEDGGTALHLTDADVTGIGTGAGTVVTAGGATMFTGFNHTSDTVVYASITGTRNSDPWTIADNCALPDLSSAMGGGTGGGAGGGSIPPDTIAPVLQSAEVSGSTLTLTYAEFLDGSSVPAAGDFAVSVNGSAATVSNVTVSGTTLVLTLPASVSAGDTVTVSYTKGTNPVRDQAGNVAANLTGQSVTDSTVDSSTLTPSTAPDANSIFVNNNNGATDVVTVAGLAIGDVLKVYSALDAAQPLASGTLGVSDLAVRLANLNLNSPGGSVWVSVTSTGKAESTRTEKTYAAETAGVANTTVYVDANLATEDGTHFKTINAAVQAVADGGTIEVAAGTYPEMVKNYYTLTNPDTTTQTVFKSFTLKGPNWAGQSTPLVHIQPTLSAIDPNLNYGHVLQAEAEGSSHPATVNVTNLWLDGSQGIASGNTVSGFVRGITLGYDVNGSIMGNRVTGTGDGIYVLGAGSQLVPVSVTVSNNRVEQLAYDPSTVGSAVVVCAAQATVSDNTFTGLNGVPFNGIKLYYKLQTNISGNAFTGFGPASATANATYGGALVSGDAEPMGYALNLTNYISTDSTLTITGNTFTDVQGILADDRASGNLNYVDFAAANMINGSWLAFGDKTRIHWLRDTLDPNQLNYVLQDSVLLAMSTPTLWLTPGTYSMTTVLVNPGKTIIFNSKTTPVPASPDVILNIQNTALPANIQAGLGITVNTALN